MKAIFEVKTIKSDWAPPFKKDITTEEYTASENEGFDRIKGNGNDETVFKVLQVQGDRVKLGYSPLFTLKNPGENHATDKTVWATKGQEETVAYLWGEKGMTKKVIYKGIAPTEISNRISEQTEQAEAEKELLVQEMPTETESEPVETETPMSNLFDQS